MESPGKKAMQPPPRKAKVTTGLRNTQNEQLTKLQYKHQVDVELLDDIRNFTKQRASIEKEYGQALLKLSANYLQRKFLSNTSDRKDANGNKLVYQVWKTLLDETEKIAKARLAAVEVYQTQISESAKTVRTAKLHVAKKCFDNMRKMHEEIQTCVTDIDKTKKLYFEEEHMAHGAREKAQDADEKLKRKRGRIFQSIAALQKNSAKFSSRKEACDIQSTNARNDYILALVASNAHQKRFYGIDLPEIIQALDCGFCENVREYIVLMARTELLTCAACQASYSKVQFEAETITSQFTLDCYLKDNPVLGNMVQYNFEPCDDDPIRIVSLEHNAALCLSKEARKWASCMTKETRTIRDCSKEISKVQSQITAGERVENVQGESGGVDLEVRLDELKQLVRKAETSKSKAEARIESLKEGGVNVDEWLKSGSEGDSLCLHDDLSRKGSTSSRSSSHFSTHSEVVGEAGSEANDSFYDSDFNDASSEASGAMAAIEARFSSVSDSDSVVEPPPPEPVKDIVAFVTEAWDETPPVVFDDEPPIEEDSVFPVREETLQSSKETEYGSPTGIRCVALFNYEAANSDELNFVEQEELEIIDEGDGDGWIKARNYKGEEGFIPQNYVEIIDIAPVDPAKIGPVSFSSVDYTMPEEDEAAGLTVKDPDLEQVSAPPSTLELQQPVIIPEGVSYCRALYDYEATCDEELTFLEGQLIEINRKVVHDVDDGWWEGKINGQLGIFPSLVIEELKIDGEPQTPLDAKSPPGSAPPPLYTPPKPQFLVPPAQVILIQPTPETELPVETGSKTQAANVEGNYVPLLSSPDSPPHSVLHGDEVGISSDEVDISLDLTLVTRDEELQMVEKPITEKEEQSAPEITISTVPDLVDSDEEDSKEKAEEVIVEKSAVNENIETVTDDSEKVESELVISEQNGEDAICKEEPALSLTEEELEQVLNALDESEASITDVTVLENAKLGGKSLSDRTDSQEENQCSDEIADELGEKEAASDSDLQPLDSQENLSPEPTSKSDKDQPGKDSPLTEEKKELLENSTMSTKEDGLPNVTSISEEETVKVVPSTGDGSAKDSTFASKDAGAHSSSKEGGIPKSESYIDLL